MRKIKYQFSKQNLNTLYCTYIRPLLEYASEVWDGSTQVDANRLEQVQLNAAQVVTRLPVFAVLDSLYYETGRKTLSLNADLDRVNIVPSALCSCGTANVTAQHYFFVCNLFIVPRNRLLASLPAVPITLDTFLYGNDLLTFENNKELHKTVLQFRKDTGRFK